MTPERLLKAKILIIEDDRTSMRLLKGILTDAGFSNIKTLVRAASAQALYQEYQPDLVILDLHLPDGDGFTVMRDLAKLDPDDYLPVLVITGDGDRGVHLRALAAGAKDFLTKPYDRSHVILRCRNLLEVRMLHNEVRHKNVTLEQMVLERTNELRKSRIDVIQRLGFAAECRDTETGLHIIRMSRSAQLVACELGLSEEECELILSTSPLHDIGKIAIPDQILLKEGPLSPEEWKIMRMHAEIGGDILSGGDSAFLEMAEQIARTHHEKWDGGGYPKGLKGEEIPIVGRICAVCDVFDALTSERPYKKAWPVDEAVLEIKKLAGTHFDPCVVSAFVKVLPRIKEVTRDVEARSNPDQRKPLREKVFHGSEGANK
jgi:putative two-component system response regulator